MDSERWKLVKTIVEEAFELEPSSRSAHLATSCGDDDELRREVESFLSADDNDGFLEQPALSNAPPVPDSAFSSPGSTPLGTVDVVRPVDLVPYSKVVVSTQGSRYCLIAVAPLDLEFLVSGGNRFPQNTRVRLYRQDSIRVGEELWLIAGTRKVVTTKITGIEVVGG
jgi:hypothetical protein